MVSYVSPSSYNGYNGSYDFNILLERLQTKIEKVVNCCDNSQHTKRSNKKK